MTSSLRWPFLNRGFSRDRGVIAKKNPGVGAPPSKLKTMLQFSLESVRRVLCLGAHSDDIEIGAGGTLLQLAGRVSDLEIWWVVFSAPGPRAEEARRSADEFLSGVANRHVRIGSFRESYFPSEWPLIKDWYEEIK